MTRDCLATLRKSDRVCDHIVLVDNGSRPEEQAILRDGLAADVRLVQLPANRGFAGGMNAGIAEAGRLGADYVWIVNNDAFPEPDCLDALVAALEADATLAAVTPLVMGIDGLEQIAGGRFWEVEGRNEFLSAVDLQYPVGLGGYWAVGTVPLFRANALAHARGFDEGYFAYWEEVDLCLRLARLGYRFRAVPEVRALHIGQVSSNGSAILFYFYVRNWLRLLRRHCRPDVRNGNTVAFVRRILDSAGCFALHGQHAKARAAVEAIIAFIGREDGPPKWFGSSPRLADFIARHPWQLIRGLGWLERSLARKVVPA
ncbi:GT2 family glycosyltransferase [Limnoglobus roseus]|uniref:GT2 family glycosyltransferase n=2 Tax=Limnoglobus roseus TaxID=2598579 RepID=A0A5C1AEN0_9BACT|nr:GT2 family glycosyltransferase [Limnoglobus roseus]